MHRLTGMWHMAALAAAVVLSAFPSSAHEVKFKSLKIEHPHVFEPEERLPKTLPLFMSIRNEGRQGDRLIDVGSPFAASAVFVRPGETGSGSPGIELPAASETTLRRSGNYVLLQDIKEPLDGYQYFPMTLTFEIAGKVEIEVYVEDRP